MLSFMKSELTLRFVGGFALAAVALLAMPGVHL